MPPVSAVSTCSRECDGELCVAMQIYCPVCLSDSRLQRMGGGKNTENTGDREIDRDGEGESERERERNSDRMEMRHRKKRK